MPGKEAAILVEQSEVRGCVFSLPARQASSAYLSTPYPERRRLAATPDDNIEFSIATLGHGVRVQHVPTASQQTSGPQFE